MKHTLQVGDRIRMRDGVIRTVASTWTEERWIPWESRFETKHLAKVLGDGSGWYKNAMGPDRWRLFSSIVPQTGDYDVVSDDDKRYRGYVELSGEPLRGTFGTVIGYTQNNEAIVVLEGGVMPIPPGSITIEHPLSCSPLEPRANEKDPRNTQKYIARCKVHNARKAQHRLETEKRRANAELVKAHMAFGMSSAEAIHQFIVDYDQYWEFVRNGQIDLDAFD